MARHLIVFAKQPVPGEVKTRLLTRYTPEAAADIYTGFILDTFATVGRAEADVTILAYDPPDAGEAMQAVLPDGWQSTAQGAGDLGERMYRALSSCTERDGDSAVLIGTDLPSLPVSHLRQAFEILAEKDVVLGPSTDGGYYLIGLNRADPEIFDGIRWSTVQVFQQTVNQVSANGQSLGLLPPWYDVDTPADLDFMVAHAEARLRSADEDADILKHTLPRIRRAQEGNE